MGGEEGLTEGEWGEGDSETDMAGRELRADEILVGGCGGGGERVHRLSRRNSPQPIGETKLRLFENSKLEIRENHQQGCSVKIMSIRSFTSIHKLSIYNGYE